MTEFQRRTLPTSEEVVESKMIEEDLSIINREISVEQVVSTGSTLLDLSISGRRRREGGLPGGIIVEAYGPSGAGKTALLAEICGSAQKRDGDVRFCDPEARLDQQYSQIYGVNIKSTFFDYHRPDTVYGMFSELIYEWKPRDNGAIHVLGGDSVAALSTDMEMEDRDKMGMRRAKEFSEGLRKTCRMIANKNWLVFFTNQIRMGEGGHETTPGGKGLPFYASLRLSVKPTFKNAKITRERDVEFTLGGTEKYKTSEDRVIGINSIVTVTKSSIDEPFRTAPISIVFGYGIDDVRANLQYIKDKTGQKTYDCFDKSFNSMDRAIAYIEESDKVNRLKERTIDVWHQIEKASRIPRKTKVRE